MASASSATKAAGSESRQGDNPNNPLPDYPTKWQIGGLGIYLIAVALLLAYLLIAFWPTASPDGPGWSSRFSLFWGALKIVHTIPSEMRLILIVALAGALGSFIHAATSFVSYVGNRRVVTSWFWWYILRPFIGMSLSLVFYFVVNGGLLSAGVAADNLNPFGIAALSGLVGMFSKQATDKLDETFTNLFRTDPKKGDAERKDKLDNPVANVTSIEPNTFKKGGQGIGITLKGTHFVQGSVVRVKGKDRKTTLIDEGQLKAELLDEDLADEGEVEVVVFNPPPGGGLSVPIKYKVEV